MLYFTAGIALLVALALFAVSLVLTKASRDKRVEDQLNEAFK